ncbi:MAG: CvpA family protein [Bacteroidales bacterium]|nr:CvpA family protein [Bacteroidales bacterium]MBN2821215.1 CvpA family protein [Bacteroidales bacterium]
MTIDIAFILVFAWASYRGFSKGFLLQVATLAALFLGIYGTIYFSSFTSEFLIDKFELAGKYLPIISFTVTFLIIVFMVHLVARLIEKVLEAVALGFANRIAGAVFSIFKYAMIISVILVVLNTIQTQKPFLPVDKLNESKLYKPLSKLAPSIFPYLKFESTREIIDKARKEIPV